MRPCTPLPWLAPSVGYDVQPRNPLEIVSVARDNGSIVGACRCRDEQVHRRDGLSSAA